MKEKYLIYVIISILIGVCFILLSTPFNENSFLVIIPSVLFFMLAPILMWETASFQIKPEEFQTKHLSDRIIRINYKNYQIECNLEKRPYKYFIPKKDITNSKISFIDRNRLNNYILKHYDDISLTDDCIPVQVDRIFYEFEDLDPCSEETKKQYITEKHSRSIVFTSIILLFFVTATINAIVSAFRSGELTFASIFAPSIIIIFLFTILITINKNSKNEQTGKLYSKRVKVYDKKIVVSGEDYYYVVRICDEKKHVLNHWLTVNKKDYDNCTYGTLYVLSKNNNSNSVFFEPEK